LGVSFIRPEAAASIARWREALYGVAVLALGLFWIFGARGLLHLLGYPVVILAFVLIWVGVQRARFRSSAGGVGAVQVDEGQISYFGPMTGGVTALADLERLTLVRSLKPAHWRLDTPQQPTLLIPVNAAGSEALFDAFATLKGLQTERMLAELNKSDDQPVVIWERHSLRPAHLSLH
jgi:hypothetical protein